MTKLKGQISYPNHFRFAYIKNISNNSLTRIHVRLLGPCFKTGRINTFPSFLESEII